MFRYDFPLREDNMSTNLLGLIESPSRPTLLQRHGSEPRARRQVARKELTEAIVTRRVSVQFGFKYLLQLFLTAAPLLVSDLVAIGVSCVSGLAVGVQFGFEASTARDIVFLGGISLLMQPAIGWAVGLYPGVGLSSLDELRFSSITTLLWVALGLAANLPTTDNPSTVITMFAVVLSMALVTVPLFRYLVRKLVAGCRWWGQPVFIFGGGAEGAAVYRRLSHDPSRGLRPIGIIDDRSTQWDDPHVLPAWYLGPPSAARRIADRFGVFWGIVALGPRSATETAELLDQFAAVVPHLLVLCDTEFDSRLWAGAHDCAGLSSLRIDVRLLSPTMRLAKRAMDVILTLTGGCLLIPFFVAVAVAIKISSPGPVFYTQRRVGHGGREFRMWKFRSMVANAEQVLNAYLEKDPEARAQWAATSKLKRDPRVTSIGRWLRKTSLDELPQIWNVLRGDMSLVGPRPLPLYDIEKHGDAYNLYKRVRPGMTGLWQVSGRSNTTYEEHVRLDLRYIRNWSPWFDLHILARTLGVVVRGEGAY
jgi:Undecaprenyl-phosphate galactose phosphotransferase WbaP